MRKLYGCKTKKEAEVKITQWSGNEAFCAYFKKLEIAERVYNNWINYHPYNQVIVKFFVRSSGKWKLVTSKKVAGYKRSSKKVPGYKRSTEVTSVTSS